MHHFLSNSRFSFSSTHNAYLTNITATKEPHTYAQAIHDPNWQKARRAFRLAAKLNVDLDIVTRRREIHRMQMVYKIKYNSDGRVDRYKARLVAKRYIQIEGVDYCETFSPTAKLTSLPL